MCVVFIAWLGKMAWNSHSIARHFNTAMESIGRAVRPKSQSLWVYTRRNKQGFPQALHETVSRRRRQSRYR